MYKKGNYFFILLFTLKLGECDFFQSLIVKITRAQSIARHKKPSEDPVTGTFPNRVLVQIVILFLDLSARLPLGMYCSKFSMFLSYCSLLVMRVMTWRSLMAVRGFNSRAWHIFFFYFLNFYYFSAGIEVILLFGEEF
jgi:hypothetical protein